MLHRAYLGAAYAVVGALSLLWLAVGPASASGPSFPVLTGRVVDEAGVLSDDTKQQLTGMLAGDQQQSGRQVVVVTLKSLQGYAIEDYGYQLGRAWGIGQKGKNTGALLIVAPAEHKTRIEVGYGLEGVLTDAQSRVIIDEYMRPAFRKGDYDTGVVAGTKAVLQTLGNKTLAPPPDEGQADDATHHGPPIGFIIFIIVMLLFFHGGRFFWPLLFLGSFGGRGGGFGGGGFSGGGFGGFSGGGGSFGGGGASGSW
jgi:uncharacterized protein